MLRELRTCLIMPTEIKSYKCAGCGNLVAANARHLYVGALTAHQVAGEDDNAWKKNNQEQVNTLDEIFCDEDCLARFIAAHLIFKS